MIYNNNMKTLALSTLILVAGCDCPLHNEGWYFGNSSKWSKDTQKQATEIILKSYIDAVGRDTIQTCIDCGIPIGWVDTPFDVGGSDANGVFQAGLWYIKIAESNGYDINSDGRVDFIDDVECIADTALAHELLHFVLFLDVGGFYDTDTQDTNTDDGKAWNWLINQANAKVASGLCMYE
jgi:hypothetical protein